MSSYHLFKRIRNIRSAARQMKPDDIWVKQTRETLLMQVANSQPVGSKPKKALSRSFNIFIPAISFKWMRAPAAIAMAIVIALFSGSLFSVSASERALPGDFLYSIKLVTEQARIALVKEPDEKVKLKTEFTKRRVDEMRQVLDSPMSDKSERVKQAAETLKRDMNTIKNQLDDVKNSSTPEKIKETAKLVDENSGSVIADLQESKNQLPAKERAKLSEAQAAASDTSVKAIEALVKAHADNSEVVTEEELLEVLKTHNEKVTKTVSESTGLKADTASSSAMLDTPSADSATTTASASSTPDTAEENTGEENEEGAESPEADPEGQLEEAVKNFTEADKLAAEKNLDEALVLVKVGTQQVFAAQKTMEENVAKQEEQDAQAQQETQEQPAEETEPIDNQNDETQATGTDTGTDSTSTATTTTNS